MPISHAMAKSDDTLDTTELWNALQKSQHHQKNSDAAVAYVSLTQLHQRAALMRCFRAWCRDHGVLSYQNLGAYVKSLNMINFKSRFKELFHPYQLLALFCAVMWAAGSFSIKSGLNSAPVAYFMGMRFVAAAMILGVYCAVTRARWPSSLREWSTHAAIGLLTNTVYMGLSALALRSISAGLASVAAGANGMFLALGATLVFGERLRKKDILGMGIALSCLCLVMYSRVGVDNSLAGIVTVLLANFVMVASNLLFKHLKHDTDVASSQCIQLATGGGLLLAIAAAFDDWHQIIWDANLFGCIGFLVATCSLGAMVIFLYLLRNASATVAGSYLFMVPIFGLIIGHYYAHEALGMLDVLGGLGVAGGVYLIQSPERAAHSRRRWFTPVSVPDASEAAAWQAALPYSQRNISLQSAGTWREA